MELQKVILTGIGPGDPDLLTVKALKAIQNADVILYDSDQCEQILSMVDESVEIVKINKNRSVAYNVVAIDIADLIEKFFLQGKKVVRLKVGDAFLFGRGGTEAAKMKSRGIQYDVIPGISAGIAASNTKKIKISEKNEADGVVFYMANQKENQDDNLHSLAVNLMNGFTLAAYMAEGRIGQIAQRLIEMGVSGVTKVVAATNISTIDEVIKLGVLSEVAADKEWDLIEPQTTFFIGKYVDIV